MQDIDKLLKGLRHYPDNLQTMVEEQLISRGIHNQNVLDAFLTVDRKLFLPPDKSWLAYADQPVSIGYSQTISQPYVVAYMTEKMELTKESKVLEIGTGCGYQTALLAELSDSVYSVEVIPELISLAKQNLSKVNIQNIQIFQGNGREGLAQHAPFSHIIVTAGSQDIPQKLVNQLSHDGKMIIPIGKNLHSQELILITKKKDTISQKTLLPVRFVPLV